MRRTSILAALALAAQLTSCRSASAPREADASAARGAADGGATIVTGRRQLMGTEFEISVADVPEGRAREAIEAALDVVAGAASRLNSHVEGSDLARINAAAGVEPVQISEETFSLLEQSRRFSELTGGTYDVTFAALLPAWRGVREQPPRLPTDAEIEAARALVDYRRLALDRAAMTAYLPEEGMAIGLGAIGEGYAIDQGAKVLLDHGLRDFIMGAGGDMMVRGSKRGVPWSLGIQHPRQPGALLGRLSFDHDQAVATSGDYERFVEIGGVRYHHILDPRTGRPSRGCASVTLTAPDATTADALATAVFVMGPVEGMRLVERTPGVEAVIVDEQLRVTMSPGMRSQVRLEPP